MYVHTCIGLYSSAGVAPVVSCACPSAGMYIYTYIGLYMDILIYYRSA